MFARLDPNSRNLRLDPLNDDLTHPDRFKEFVRIFCDPPRILDLNDGESESYGTASIDTVTETTTGN